MAGKSQWQYEIKTNVENVIKQVQELQGRVNTLENGKHKIDIGIDSSKLEKVISNLDKMLVSLGKGTNDFKEFENLSKQLNNIISEVQSLNKAFNGVNDSGINELLSSIKNIDKSLSSLNEHITSVNKNFGNIGKNANDNVGQINSVKKATEELANATKNLGNAKKNLDNVTFNPNTEGFDKIIQKLRIAEEKAKQISKITKSSIWSDSQGKYLESYNIKYKNGTSEIRGESSNKSGINVLRANEVAYNAKAAEQEAKAFNKAWEEANKVNNALNETKQTLSSLSKMPELGKQFSDMKDNVYKLNKEVSSGNMSVSEYTSAVKKLTSEYSNLVKIQQNRDVNTYKQNAKAAEQEAKAFNKAWEEANKVNNALNETKQTLSSLSKMPELGKQFSDMKDNVYKLNKEVSSGNMSVSEYTSAVKKLTSEYSNLVKIQQNRDVKTYEQNAKAAEQEAKAVAELNSYVNKTNVKFDGMSKSGSSTYVAQIQKISQALQELKTIQSNVGKTKNISEVQDKVKELQKTIQQSFDAIGNISKSSKGASSISIGKEIDKISKYLKDNTRLSKQARNSLESYLRLLSSGDPSVNIERIHNEFLKVAAAERKAGREGKSFFDIFKNKTLYGFANQLAMYYLSFYDFVRYARNAITTIVELDDALVDLKKTAKMSSNDFEEFYLQSNDVAKQMGVSTQAIIDQASSWSRLGYSTKQAASEMSQLSSQFASISPGMDTEQAQSGLVSVMKADVYCLYVQKCA